MVPLHAAQPELAKLLGEALRLLSTATREIDQEPELLLLRHLARPKQRPANNEPAMTPSQLRNAAATVLDIALVDPDGRPQEGVAFEIKAPDGNVVKSHLDKTGTARARSSCPGTFIVIFPELDGADWDGDGAQELPPANGRSAVRRHAVIQGERMTTIARKYGFANWDTVWRFSANAELRQRRGNPDVLFPGDEVVIPGKLRRMAEVSGGSARYVVQSSPEVLRVRLLDVDLDGVEEIRAKGTPDTGAVIESVLGTDGTLEVLLPPAATDLKLDLFRGKSDTPFLRYDLALGHIDPSHEISGVQGRLANLGYYSGPVDGKMNDATRAAVSDFRLVHLGEESDVLDAAFFEALGKAHAV
jgi:N-acetylmuramoyl-L-alanine amidase